MAAFTILAGFVFPLMLALVASTLSVAAVHRHLTLRQLVYTAVVLATGAVSVAAMYSSLAVDQSVALWPLLVIVATLVFSVVQFGSALLLGAIARLRELAASQTV